MRKSAAMIMVAVLFALTFFHVSVYADVTPVTTNLTKPDVSYSSVGTDDLYHFYMTCQWSDSGSFVYYYDLSTSENSVVQVVANGTSWWVQSSNQFSLTTTMVRLSDGSIYSSHTNNGMNYNNQYYWLYLTGAGNPFPSSYSTFLGAYIEVPSKITYTHNATLTTDFVTWATAPILQTYVHSVLPKPDADEFNRFVVLTSENESHLLWLNYHFQFLYGVQSQTSATFEEYDIRQSDYYAPTVRYSDDGFSFRIQMDPILFLYLQNLNFSGSVCCNYTLTDYNLITGEFNSMSCGNIEDLQPDTYYNMFSGYIDFDAVGIDLFGLNYEDTRTDGHLHRAAVLYSTDPDFERWKQSVITWLENIYNVISATETAEDVTIDNNIEAASELTEVIDALQPTDENGSKINTADVVSERFSDAGAYIGDMRDGGTAINQLIDTFFFSSPFFYVPVIVALALGLLITILGKNKSD